MKWQRWMASLEAEAHETFGAIEVGLGVGLLVGLGLYRVLADVRWLANLTLLAALVAGLWYGQHMEYRFLGRLGVKHVRGTLLLRVTWLNLAWCLLWCLMLWGVVVGRAWDAIEGWTSWPMLLLILLGAHWTGLGIGLGVRRWLAMGVVLVVVAAALPAIPFLRQNLFLAAGLGSGLLHLVGGYLGYRAFEAELVDRQRAPTPSAE